MSALKKGEGEIQEMEEIGHLIIMVPFKDRKKERGCISWFVANMIEKW